MIKSCLIRGKCLSVCLSIYQSIILSFNSIPFFTFSLSLLLFTIFSLQDMLFFCVNTLVVFCIITIKNSQNGNTGIWHNRKKTSSPLRSVIAGFHCICKFASGKVLNAQCKKKCGVGNSMSQATLLFSQIFLLLQLSC